MTGDSLSARDIAACALNATCDIDRDVFVRFGHRLVPITSWAIYEGHLVLTPDVSGEVPTE